ncbi:tetratricopeptide repeat protein [bacterium]|nr:tetratricopeptide repeat protein [bacterium]
MRKLGMALLLALFAGFLLFTACEQPAITSAKVYIDSNELDRALEQCEVALTNNPSDPDAHFVMGKVYEKQKNYLQMNEAFTRSLEISSKYSNEIQQKRNTHWTNHLNQGVGLYQQGKSAEAAEKFLIATRIMPEKGVAFRYLGLAYLDAEQPEKALESFRKAYEIDPMDLEAYFMIGRSYFELKDYKSTADQMKSFIEKADESHQFFSEALYYLGLAYNLLDEPDEAIRVYKDYLVSDPDNTAIKFNLGAIYLKREQWEDALEMFSAVYESDPQDFQSCQSIGQAYLGMEKWADAVRYLEKAADLQPDNAGVWFWLGTAYARNNQLEKAKAAFDKNKELSGGE